MGRLNSIGSSQASKDILFPDGFDGGVMLLVLETWQAFSLRQQVRKENNITALFHTALKEAEYEAGRSWFVTLEDPVTDPIWGDELGRNDLRFYPPRHSAQKIFFPLECKRLRVTTNSGFKHLSDEYVKNGLQKFVDGKYSSGLPYGGMLGYVMDNRVDEAFETVQREIEKRRVKLKMKKNKPICAPSSTLPLHRYSLDTFHFRSDGELTVHHLLVGVAVDQPRNLAKSVTVE